MIPELGHFSLILALCMALVLGTLPIIGAFRNQLAWIAVARPAARFVTFAYDPPRLVQLVPSLENCHLLRDPAVTNLIPGHVGGVNPVIFA